MKNKIILITLCSIAISGCSNTSLNSKELPLQEETIVFVHGAHFSGSSWLNVANNLEKKGFNTVSVNLPGRDLSVDPNEVTLDVSSRALCDEINPINTPIVLVAHSQGGAVTNNALSICPQKDIKSIIYIAAVAPIDGDTPYSLLSKTDEVNYFKGISYDNNSGWLMVNDRELLANVFTNSKSAVIRNEIMSQAVNEPAVIGDGVVHYDNDYFSQLDKFYIHTKFDQIISIDSQEKIASKINIKKTIVLNTGHLPMMSAPKLLANEIESLVN